jgi:single-strand DNA-binding protein
MNSVNLIGRLTRDPDKRSTPKGTDVSVLRLAVERPGEGADYVTVTAFGKLAQSCNQYLKKGRQVAIAGRLNHSEWVKDGQRHERLEVVAAAVEFLGQRPAQQNGAQQQPRVRSRGSDYSRTYRPRQMHEFGFQLAHNADYIARFEVERDPGQPPRLTRYSVVLRYLDRARNATAVRVYDNAHGADNPDGDHHMHRCDREGHRQQPPEIFHLGEPHEAFKEARNLVENGFEEMIAGWQR